ncbi:zinc finger, CCHC-type containing protein [Tanacetum coccineum]
MSNKVADIKLETQGADMTKSSQTNSQLFLDQLDVDVSGTIVVMIGMMWGVNSITRRYLSTYFVVSDSKGNMIHFTARGSISHNFLRLKEGSIYLIMNFVVHLNKEEFQIMKDDTFMLDYMLFYAYAKVNEWLADVAGYVTNVGRTTHQKSGSRTLDFYLANHRDSPGTDNQEKDEKQSQNDKTGLGMEKTVKDKAKSKPESQSSQKVNPSQLRGQSQENISLGIEIVNP